MSENQYAEEDRPGSTLGWPLRCGIDYAGDHLDLEVAEAHLIPVRRQPIASPIQDRAQAMRDALEHPMGFPALRRALTPDDHVTIVVDEHLPHLVEMLIPILEHLTQAGISPEAITLLCAPPAASQPWLDDLPDAFQEVRVEVHDPTDRRKLSYLAATKKGHRIYLNRTAVDADQIVVLSRRNYDPWLGYSGSEGALYPVLSDEATRQEYHDQPSLEAPEDVTWPAREEATEVAWLLGAPFMVQVIEGSGDEVVHVLGGLADTSPEGQRLLNARWRIEVDRPADTVVAPLGGDPARHTFADLANALTAASRVVKQGGRIVLLTKANPPLGPAVELLRGAEDAAQAIELLNQSKLPDMASAYAWAQVSQNAHIYLLSGIAADVVEELFAVPLEHAGQVQRLLAGEGSCILLPDANKTLAVLTP